MKSPHPDAPNEVVTDADRAGDSKASILSEDLRVAIPAHAPERKIRKERTGNFSKIPKIENGDLLNGSKVILDRFTILITVYYFILEDSTVKSWYKLKRVYLFWEIIGFNSHFLKVLVIFELNSKFPFCSPLEASSYIHIISIERVLPLSRSLSLYIYIVI